MNLKQLHPTSCTECISRICTCLLEDALITEILNDYKCRYTNYQPNGHGIPSWTIWCKGMQAVVYFLHDHSKHIPQICAAEMPKSANFYHFVMKHTTATLLIWVLYHCVHQIWHQYHTLYSSPCPWLCRHTLHVTYTHTHCMCHH